MKKTVIIGSTTLDIIINVSSLPSRKADVNIKSQSVVLGGCAYNVQTILRLAEAPHVLCSPVGTGMYGDCVWKELAALGITPFLRVADRDNGCCYCYVEDDGERTFLSYHGVEYGFSESWMSGIAPEDIDGIYVCGLEIEEPTGDEIVSYLRHTAATRNPTIYFAPGPRIRHIAPDKMDALFALHPVVHLNKEELLEYTATDTIESGARKLYGKTGNTIVITDGANGSYWYDGEALYRENALPTTVVDTIGAGDAHIGAIIACRKRGIPFAETLRYANTVAAAVVATRGATLSAEAFKAIPAPAVSPGLSMPAGERLTT
jgi:sugar/nucleoside kinase (ribokinase family)